MFKLFLQSIMYWRSCRWAAASLLAIPVLSGCTSYVTSDVIAFTAWDSRVSDRDRTYVFKRDAQQQNSIEQSTYEAQVADELSRYNFRQVMPSAARYAVKLTYGTRKGSIVVSQPVYIDPWWRGWERPGPWGSWSMFGPMPPAYIDQTLPVFMQRLTIRITEHIGGKEVYKVTATTPSEQPSLPAAMPYLVRSALADFPLQNGTTRRLRLPADLHASVRDTQASNKNEKALETFPAGTVK